MTRARSRFALLLSAALVASGGAVLTAAPAHAATIPVTDWASLEAAIGAASDHDTIVFSNDITATGDLSAIGDSITIDGGGYTFDGDAASFSGFTLGTGVTVTITNIDIVDTDGAAVTALAGANVLTLEDIDTNSGIVADDAHVTVSDSIFSARSSLVTGTAITVIVSNTDFVDTDSDGLEIDASVSTVTLTEVSATGNDSDGIDVNLSGSGSTLTATSLEVSGNGDNGLESDLNDGATATVSAVLAEENGYYGIDFNVDASTLTITDAVSSRNYSDGFDIDAYPGASVTLTDVHADTSVAGDGFEVYVDDATFTITGATANANDDDGFDIAIDGDTAATLSGVHADDNGSRGFELLVEGIESATLTTTDATATGNDDGFEVATDGNGTFNGTRLVATGNADDGIEISPISSGATVTITDSTFDANGYGLYLDPDDGESGIDLTLASSTISNNDYDGILGDISTSMFRIINSTISGNGADFDQGIDLSGGEGDVPQDAPLGTLLVAHTTITGNSASGSSTVRLSGTFEATFDHVILAANAGDADLEAGPNVALTVDHSLVGTADAAAEPAITGGTGNLYGVDPQLGPLTDNGGPTLTHLPAATSPAIGAGNPAITGAPAYDQRGAGFARIVSVIDMGALERPAELVPTGVEIAPLGFAALALLAAGGILALRRRA